MSVVGEWEATVADSDCVTVKKTVKDTASNNNATAMLTPQSLPLPTTTTHKHKFIHIYEQLSKHKAECYRYPLW